MKPGTTATIVKREAMAAARSHSFSSARLFSADFTKPLLLAVESMDELVTFIVVVVVGVVVIVFCVVATVNRWVVVIINLVAFEGKAGTMLGCTVSITMIFLTMEWTSQKQEFKNCK